MNVKTKPDTKVEELKIIPAEWIVDYLVRSGAEYICFNNLVVCDKGFLTFVIKDNVLLVSDCYGDGRFWIKFLDLVARENNCSIIRFGTKRNWRAFNRRFGFRLIEEKDGYFVLEKEV